MTTKRWDAGHYNQSFSFIWQYGAGILELLDPKPGETILDLGCGTGHLSGKIAATGATVVGIDSSGEMVDTSRLAYPDIDFHQMDATDFHLDRAFDAVFSNAVLHWVHPPERAATCIRAALKQNGRFVAEFGGHGNVQQIVDAIITELEQHGHPDAAEWNPWYFPSISEYTNLLEAHGFEPVFARLYDRPTLLDGGESGLADWLTMFSDPFFSDVSEDHRRQVIDAAIERLRPALFRDGDWFADYRRLQVIAIRR